MAAVVKLLLWYVVFGWLQSSGSAATFTINPPTLDLSGNSSTGRVTMRCSPSETVGPGRLTSIEIKQTPYGSSVIQEQATELAFTSSYDDGTAKIPPNSPLRNEVEVAGGISSGYLELIIPEATCGSRFEATYICVEFSAKGSSVVPTRTEQRKNFTVEVGTGTVDMTADPLLSTYQVNTALTLTCNGQIGNAETGVQISWVWQYRDSSGGSFPGSFPGSIVDYDRPEDIVDGSVVPDGPCQRRQTSTLTRTLTPQDDGREYRCFVRRGNFPFDPIEGHVGSYTIQNVVTESGGTGGSTGDDNNSWTRTSAASTVLTSGSSAKTTSTIPPTTRDPFQMGYDEGRQAGFSQGVALGAGVTLAVVVVVVVAATVWMWRRQWKLPCAVTARPEKQKATELSSAVPSLASETTSSIPSPAPMSGPYSELRREDVGLRSPYSELNPYSEPTYTSPDYLTLH